MNSKQVVTENELLIDETTKTLYATYYDLLLIHYKLESNFKTRIWGIVIPDVLGTCMVVVSS